MMVAAKSNITQIQVSSFSSYHHPPWQSTGSWQQQGELGSHNGLSGQSWQPMKSTCKGLESCMNHKIKSNETQCLKFWKFVLMFTQANGDPSNDHPCSHQRQSPWNAETSETPVWPKTGQTRSGGSNMEFNLNWSQSVSSVKVYVVHLGMTGRRSIFLESGSVENWKERHETSLVGE